MEKKLEKKHRLWTKSKGGISLKLVTPGNNGAPDRLTIMPGNRIYFFEFKNGKAGRVSPAQTDFLNMLKGMGCVCDVISFQEELDYWHKIIEYGDI